MRSFFVRFLVALHVTCYGFHFYYAELPRLSFGHPGDGVALVGINIFRPRFRFRFARQNAFDESQPPLCRRAGCSPGVAL